MANLLIRDLDDDVVRQLKAAAKAHGRSLQAEIHDALQRAGARSLAETRRVSARLTDAMLSPRPEDRLDPAGRIP